MQPQPAHRRCRHRPMRSTPPGPDETAQCVSCGFFPDKLRDRFWGRATVDVFLLLQMSLSLCLMTSPGAAATALHPQPQPVTITPATPIIPVARRNPASPKKTSPTSKPSNPTSSPFSPTNTVTSTSSSPSSSSSLSGSSLSCARGAWVSCWKIGGCGEAWLFLGQGRVLG